MPAGLLGALLALLLTLLAFFAAPALEGFAFLSTARLGGPAVPRLVLLGLGLIVFIEFPLVLFTIVRLARSGAPARTINWLHFAYTFLPSVYGALGAIITGQRWWLWMMFALVPLRFVSSALFLRFAELRPRALAKVQESPVAEPTPSSAPAPSRASKALHRIRGFILDMDGVLYRGNTVREGAIEFITYLNRAGIPYVCVTNNASRTQAMYQAKLDALGIPIDASRVIGSAKATAEWLAGRVARGARVLVVGEAGLREELVGAGFTLVEVPPADFVVVGIDTTITYEKLKQAALAIRQNAQFIGTNPDTTFPSEEGLVPGNGATLAFLEAATGVKPTIVGKPGAAMMDVAVAHLGLPRDQVAMIGDRLETDILGAQNAGLISILLHGGVASSADMAASPIRADHVFYDLGDLLEHYERER